MGKVVHLLAAICLLNFAVDTSANEPRYHTSWIISDPIDISDQRGEVDAATGGILAERGYAIAKSRLLPSGAAVVLDQVRRESGKVFAEAGDEFVKLEGGDRLVFCSMIDDRKSHLCLIDADADGKFESRTWLGSETGLPLFRNKRLGRLRPIVEARYEIVSPEETETVFSIRLGYSQFFRIGGDAAFSLSVSNGDRIVPVRINARFKAQREPTRRSILGATFEFWRRDEMPDKRLFIRPLEPFARIPFETR